MPSRIDWSVDISRRNPFLILINCTRELLRSPVFIAIPVHSNRATQEFHQLRNA